MDKATFLRLSFLMSSEFCNIYIRGEHFLPQLTRIEIQKILGIEIEYPLRDYEEKELEKEYNKWLVEHGEKTEELYIKWLAKHKVFVKAGETSYQASSLLEEVIYKHTHYLATGIIEFLSGMSTFTQTDITQIMHKAIGNAFTDYLSKTDAEIGDDANSDNVAEIRERLSK